METPKEFGAKLTAAREKAGKPSYRKLERLAIDRMGTGFAPTNETIRLYHAGAVTPEKADVMLVGFLATVYDCDIADLSETVSRHAEVVRDLLMVKRRCIAA